MVLTHFYIKINTFGYIFSAGIVAKKSCDFLSLVKSIKKYVNNIYEDIYSIEEWIIH